MASVSALQARQNRNAREQKARKAETEGCTSSPDHQNAQMQTETRYSRVMQLSCICKCRLCSVRSWESMQQCCCVLPAPCWRCDYAHSITPDSALCHGHNETLQTAPSRLGLLQTICNTPAMGFTQCKGIDSERLANSELCVRSHYMYTSSSPH